MKLYTLIDSFSQLVNASKILVGKVFSCSCKEWDKYNYYKEKLVCIALVWSYVNFISFHSLIVIHLKYVCYGPMME